jgi:hypothetical protein
MAKERAMLTAGDIALNAASILLAFFSASFAGYMVMYGPPDGNSNIPAVTVALEPFDTSRTKLGNYDALDPIVTGSITKDANATDKEANQAVLDLLRTDQHLRYNLRTVFQNTAFVDISNGHSSITLPLERGTLIPGVGKVLRFEKRKGKWVVVTGSAEISEEGMITVR